MGSAARSFAFATARQRTTFHPNPRGGTLLILFHSRCAHCIYEFDTLDPHCDRLAGTELLLLTTEDSLNMAAIERRWPRLARSEQVTWGTVDRDVFAHHFGAVMTPALFLFDATRKLAGKWLGETKLEVLLERGHMGDGTPYLFAAVNDPERPLRMEVGLPMAPRGREVGQVEKQDGTLCHAYHRKWATERKHLPDVDVVAAGGGAWRKRGADSDSAT